jgi:hypothetical protein
MRAFKDDTVCRRGTGTGTAPKQSWGCALANAGHDSRSLQAHLGHRNIQHAVRYTELAPDRFKDFWR